MDSRHFRHAFWALSLAITQAHALELYDDGVNAVNLSGFADIKYSTEEVNFRSGQFQEENVKVDAGSTRFRFTLSHEVSPSVVVNLISEYKINLVAGDSERRDLFENRLGSVGYIIDRFGKIEIHAGKYWSPIWSYVVGYMDGPLNTDCDNCGIYQVNDGGVLGSGRLDKAAIYMNEVGNIHYGFHVAFTQDFEQSATSATGERDYSAGFALEYLFEQGYSIGFGYTQSQLDVDTGSPAYFGITPGRERNVRVAALMLRGKYHGFTGSSSIIPYARYYHVTGYNGNENTSPEVAVLGPETFGTDVWLRYFIEEVKLEPFVYLSFIDFDDDENGNVDDPDLGGIEGNRFTTLIGLGYKPSSQLEVTLEYRNVSFENRTGISPDDTPDTNDALGLKMRYYFDPRY